MRRDIISLIKKGEVPVHLAEKTDDLWKNDMNRKKTMRQKTPGGPPHLLQVLHTVDVHLAVLLHVVLHGDV